MNEHEDEDGLQALREIKYLQLEIAEGTTTYSEATQGLRIILNQVEPSDPNVTPHVFASLDNRHTEWFDRSNAEMRYLITFVRKQLP